MTIKELTQVLNKEYGVLIITKDLAAGFYRFGTENIPPTLQAREVANIRPHTNGKEIVIELKGEG